MHYREKNGAATYVLLVILLLLPILGPILLEDFLGVSRPREKYKNMNTFETFKIWKYVNGSLKKKS